MKVGYRHCAVDGIFQPKFEEEKEEEEKVEKDWRRQGEHWSSPGAAQIVAHHQQPGGERELRDDDAGREQHGRRLQNDDPGRLGPGSGRQALLKNFPTISGLNALNSRQMRSGVPKPEKFVSYRNTKRSGLYRRQLKDSTMARIEPWTFDLLAQLANHYTIWLIN